MGLEIKIDVNDSAFNQKITEGKGIYIPRELGNTINDILRSAIVTAADYPPTTAGNFPPPPYYERGVGMYDRYGNLRQDRLSENLGAQWDYEVRVTPEEVDGVVVNTATYSGYVQDEDEQAWFHKLHNWSTMQDILRAQIGEATRGPGFTISVASNKLNDLVNRIANFFNT